MRYARLLLLPLSIACYTPSVQDSTVVLERPPLEETLSRIQQAVGAVEYGKRGKPVTVSGRALFLGVETDAHMTIAPGGNFLYRVVGELSNTTGFDGETVWKTGYDHSTRTLALEGRDTALFTFWVQTGHWLDARAPIDLAWAEEDTDGSLITVSMRDAPMHAFLRIDKTTGLPVAMTIPTNSGEQVWTLADWRDVGGLKVPHDVTIEQEGAPTSWGRWTTHATPPITVRSPYLRPTGLPNDVSFDAELPFELDTTKTFTGHILVYPTIEGMDLGAFILDTGAGGMCIDAGVADELGLDSLGEVLAIGTSGKTNSGFRKGTLFELGQLRFENPIYVDLDLSFLEGAFGEKVVGIVGYEVFARCVMEIDPKSGETRLYPHTSDEQSRNWQELLLDQNQPTVRASFEGDHSGYFNLDTGSGGSVTFHSPTVEALKLLEGREVTASVSGGVGGMGKTWRGAIEYFELAGHRFENPTVQFASTEVGGFANRYAAGNLGQKFLEPFTLVLDYSRERIAFVPR